MYQVSRPVTPLVYEVVEETTAQTTVVDVLLGSVAFAGAVAGAALLFGVVLAGIMIGFHRRRGRDDPTGHSSGVVRLGLDN